MYIYDLSQAPASYDFLVWMQVCATDAQGEFDVAILPGPNHGFRQDDLPPHDIEVRRQFLDNVMLPAIRLWNVGNINLFPKEPIEGKRVRYMADALFQNKPLPSIKVPEWALRYVRAKYPENTVTITLREATHHPVRNSALQEWFKVADWLEANGFNPVFIRDSEQTEDLPYPVFWEAHDLPLRAALYEHAAQNMMVNNGTNVLAFFNTKVNYIVFKMLAPTPSTTPEWFNKIGIEPGRDLPWAVGPNQRIVWSSDKAETIIKAFQDTPRVRSSETHFPPIMGKINLISRTNAGLENVHAQIRENFKRDVPWVRKEVASQPSVIVGGGPSLADTWKHIRQRKSRGQQIVALNNTHDYLIERGIVPDYMVLLDAREDNLKFLTKPHKGVKYLLASQCHPKCFDALKGFDVRMWHAYDDGVKPIYEKEAADRPWCLIPGGATVGLRALYLLWEVFTQKRFHLYGFDSSYRDEKHAYPQDIEDSGGEFTVKIGDESFRCAGWMYRQAEDFQDQWEHMTSQGCEIAVHGDGLIPALANQLRRANGKRAA